MLMIEAEIATEPGLGIEPDFPEHRMTLERFERLVESGIFADGSPVLLWHGRLVEQMTQGESHSFVVTLLYQLMLAIIPQGWCVYQEKPIVIWPASIPEPDISVVRGSIFDYRKRRPRQSDVALFVEVADSSLRFDSNAVLKTFAAAGIPTYWIVNLLNHRVEVYTDPTGQADRPTYRNRRDYGPEDEVPVVLDGVEVGRIACRELFD